MQIGLKYGKSAAQVCLRWLVQQPEVVAIPKASSRKNAEANLNIFDFTLTAENLQAIAALPKDRRLCNPPFAPLWDKAAA
jgi:2,5-diketo-D-gluconate reductase B